MVCLGNICRSPLAEGILKTKINDRNLTAWAVESAGTGSWHVGKLPDSRSIDKAREYNIDITDQRARQFQVADFDVFDKILVMDASNYQDVIKLSRSEADKSKVEMIMNFASPGKNQQVPDPYWDNNGFEQVYQMLDVACDRLLDQFF